MHVAVKRLRSRISYTTLISKLMPKEFTLTELEQAYECILGTDLDKRNFRKKLLKLEVLSPLGKKRQKGRSRPAELYRFTSQDIKEIEVL
jgi:8-oxo-dGTP diphosphatase